ncbi:putative E3 ubiquitin-protein ligase MARCH [Helianthus annuus]|uniref:E3 ubiquitin-protein ligase MARCH n=1 Tax=Helianthus annuus TaxID=4232 RepID=A0A9K3IM98_HELAN|nr:putative E3 ubiquitin-protein ligase MARCH [Helianthus annuus]KAJ0905543.1 putative E3 ubiquitin-protein ligase MARCH [Helianthus annuus]
MVEILTKHIFNAHSLLNQLKFTFTGVLFFFVLIGFFGLLLHCSSFNNDPRMAGCQNCVYCFPSSMEACFGLVIVFVVIFVILGIAYGFLAATMAIQRIWQKTLPHPHQKRTNTGIYYHSRCLFGRLLCSI